MSWKKFGVFFAKRILQMIVQVFGIATVVFFLVRLLPGNPALAYAGPGARQDTIEAIEERLGLNKPVVVQYSIYLRDLVNGDWGTSIFTGHPVIEDLLHRLPATLELITIAMGLSIIIGIILGVIVAFRPKGLVRRVLFVYGMLAGALPDFWIALLFVFVFYFLLRWAPAPLGRLGLVGPPDYRTTGLYLVDSLIKGDFATFSLAAKHLALPVLTLTLVYMGSISKMSSSNIDEIRQSEFIEHARACGLRGWTMLRYILRNALSPVATAVAFSYGYMVGGVVLVEMIFSWGGMGEYAVRAVNYTDYAALQGFVLVVGASVALVYLALDIVYMLLDPRIEL